MGVEQQLGVTAAETHILISESQISVCTTVQFISKLVTKTLAETNN